MGYFGVLLPAAQAGLISDGPTIRRCHINLWSLSSLIPGRRLFYFDVGLELAAGVQSIGVVELLLPFRVEEGPWKGRAGNDKTAQDLFDTVTTGPAAELVFGGPVRIEQQGGLTALHVGDYAQPLHLARLNSTEIRPVDTGDQRRDSSHYVVPLTTPIPAGEARYIRMRWRIFGAGPLWSWKRARGGARFDLRVYDVRESRFADSEKPLRERMVPINEINVFLIAPAKFQAGTTSPEWRYLRVLEAGAWRQYLRGAAYLSLSGAMIVYYWRHQPTSMVDPDHPFRVFADFDLPGARSWWQELARLAAALAVLAAIVRGVGGGVDISHFPWRTVLVLLGMASLLGAVSLAERVQRFVAQRFLRPRQWLRKLERSVIGKL